MAHTDPYAALLEHVTNPTFYGAQLDSVRLLKQRALPGRQLYGVTFTDAEGRNVFCVCQVRQQDDGSWSAHGSAGGSLGGAPGWETPRANLGGSPGGGTLGGYFGGFVESDLAGEVTRVRLVSADGLIVEDTVEEGMVLFLADGPVGLPLSAELYDQAGQLVARHVAKRAFPSSTDAS